MLDQLLDRMLDRVLTAFVDKLTDIGLVLIGLADRAGSGCRAFIKELASLRSRRVFSGYVKNLAICAASVSIVILLLVIRLSMIEVQSTAGIVRLVKARDNSWDIVQEEEKVITADGKNISDDVMKYKSSVEKYAKEYDMEDYQALIYAVIEQESGGNIVDIMQSSTCLYNEEYPRVVGGITDQDYSIKCGVQYLAYCLDEAGVSDPYDISRIKLALQGYNYGHNYIEWAMKRDGGYTKENGDAFAALMQKANGWSSYGDNDYPAHVLRYYPDEYQGKS